MGKGRKPHTLEASPVLSQESGISKHRLLPPTEQSPDSPSQPKEKVNEFRDWVKMETVHVDSVMGSLTHPP